jgi:hypothetical protein
MVSHPGGDIGQCSREPACYLDVAEILESADDALIPSHDRRNAKVNISGFPVKTGTELPPRSEHGDHVARR